MGYLYKGKGVFILSDTDHNVGSYFSVEDLAEILEIDEINVLRNELERMKLISMNGRVDEKDLYGNNVWKELKTACSKKPIVNRASFDEYVLKAIFKRAYPNMEIEQQAKVNKKQVDFKLTLNDKIIYVEFDGPGHFIQSNSSPLERIDGIEQATGCEAVSWPFWVQRCEANVRALFDKKQRGYGALWTSKAYFGDFSFSNSAEIIIKLSSRFNAIQNDGIGYFYEKDANKMCKPMHPIIDKIRKGKKDKTMLIPKGEIDDINFWMPSELRV